MERERIGTCTLCCATVVAEEAHVTLVLGQRLTFLCRVCSARFPSERAAIIALEASAPTIDDGEG